jgi:hypothetical protein
MPRDAAEIEDCRTRVEARLCALLEEAQSSVTIDDIKHYIFGQSHTTRPRVWIDHVADLFGRVPGTIEMDTVLSVFQDAWNYFPHRSLNGSSPIERFLELS